MTQRRSLLEGVTIPDPCRVGWDEMTGNDEVRYCSQCRKSVYNLSRMTQSQAERLVAASHGNLCAQFTNLADGSIKTLPDLSPPTQHKRPSSAAAAVVTAMLGIGVSAGAAAPPRNPGAKTQSALRKESSTASRTAISGGLGATLSGVVSDEDGIQVAGAMVTVTNQETGAGLTTKTLGNGFFQFDGLAAGSYSITAAAGGYSVKSFNGIELSEGQNHLTDVV